MSSNTTTVEREKKAIHDNNLVGKSMKRPEDPQKLQGKGQYVADIQLSGMVHAAFVRSTHAHAKIKGIDFSKTKKKQGILETFSTFDLTNIPPLPLLVPHPALKPALLKALTDGIARYVGESVGVVVGDDQYIAEDGVSLATVDYEPLNAVTDARKGLQPDAPILHEDLGTNFGSHIIQEIGDTQSAIAKAPIVISEKVNIRRAAAHPLETRGIVANYTGDKLTVWASTQTPHNLRRVLCVCLGLPEHRVQVITPDVGGGFGTKVIIYTEDVVVAWLAMKLNRPVKWVEDRREHFLTASHEREQYHEATIAVDLDGRILAVEDKFWADQGAYVPWGIIVPYLTSTTIPGPYKIPNYRCDGYVVYTNKTPVAPYRGAGRPQGVTVMERLLDRAAEKLQMDPAEIRLRNFIKKEEFPYEVGLIYRDGSPLTYDTGDYETALHEGMEAIEYLSFRKNQQQLFQEGRYVGIGIGAYVEGTGLGPFEGATVRIDNNGHVVVYTGGPDQGQGHKTIFAQIAADQLGYPLEQIKVIQGDTDMIPRGIGTFASRIAAVGGSAVNNAAKKVRKQLLLMGSNVLGEPEDKLGLKDGKVFVEDNPDQSITVVELAARANFPAPGSTQQAGVFPGLEATEYFQPRQATYSNGIHFAKVEVDPELGRVKILDYVIVHECGNLLNPMLVDGQVQGGLLHGISGALFEELVYDANGQMITGTYMDYLIPTACETPDAKIIHQQVPTPLNPLGVKGAGEGGTIPAWAAIGGAIEDALRPLGVCIEEFPVTPNRLYAAIKRGQKS